MTHYHEKTAHTRASVSMPRFINWDTQPSEYKKYPGFFQRVSFENLQDYDFWIQIGGVTEKISYGHRSHTRRVVPSAGALYPTEMYLHVRGRKDLDDGIYHYETESKTLAFLRPLGFEGVEPFLGIPGAEGVLIILTSSWFRTAWKYGKRALRYCLADFGHQVGAIEAAALIHEKSLLYFPIADAPGLSRKMGLGKTELPLGAVLLGELTEVKIKPLNTELPYVLPTDYHEETENVYAEFEKVCCQPKILAGRFFRGQSGNFFIDKKKLEDAVYKRRSIRAFQKGHSRKEDYGYLSQSLLDSASGFSRENINIWSVVHPVFDGLESGLYLNSKLVRKGDFRELAKALCLDQSLASDGMALFFITGKSDDYHGLMTASGIIGHRFYLDAEQMGLGVSGIGAFYDSEVQDFLNTGDWILYSLAVGRKQALGEIK